MSDSRLTWRMQIKVSFRAASFGLTSWSIRRGESTALQFDSYIMFVAKTFVLSLSVVVLLLGTQSCSAKVPCASCPQAQVNISTDAELNTGDCALEDADICSLVLRIDYTYSNESFVLISGSPASTLVLTNGEPMVNEAASIWFDQVRVQRMATIVCFASASCGLDLLKQIYRDKCKSKGHKTFSLTPRISFRFSSSIRFHDHSEELSRSALLLV